MTQLKRWDNGAVIYEEDADPAELIAACSRLGISMFRADLAGANLTNAKLIHANLTDAELMHANLTDANLTNAKLIHANLTDANLTGANLTGAELMHANLTDAKLPLYCRFRRIRENYMAMRAYLVALGHHKE